MRGVLVFLLGLSSAFGQFTLNKLGYLKFPYEGQNFGMLTGAAHKAAYDDNERIMYVLGSQTASSQPRLLHMVDMGIPSNPRILYTHQFSASENGRANDVAVCPDTVAVSLESPIPTKEGHIEIFRPFKRGDSSLLRLGREPVGVDPKGLAFTDDCQKLVIANEGRGDLDPTANRFTDPDGSVTVMLRNDQGYPAFVTINFRFLIDGREGEYLNKGVRWVYRGNHNGGNIVNEMWQDLEPEDVTISRDQRFAFVSMPENNAVARIDINAYNVQEIFGLGEKNWTLRQMDCSDVDGGGNLHRFHASSMYQVTDLETITLTNGQEYLLTADQGVIKRYTKEQLNANTGFDESRMASTVANDFEFDESSWTAQLKTDVRDMNRLGRWHIRYTDAADQIVRLITHVTGYGGRSVSMWSMSTMSLYSDTGDELERTEVAAYPSTFNGDATNGTVSPVAEADQRSNDMGTEPTSVAVGRYTTTNTNLIAVGTRTGHIHLYAELDNQLRHQMVHREGSTTSPWGQLYTANTAGDAIISDIGVIDNDVSPNGKTLVYVIGSATGSLGVYEVDEVITKK